MFGFVKCFCSKYGRWTAIGAHSSDILPFVYVSWGKIAQAGCWYSNVQQAKRVFNGSPYPNI